MICSFADDETRHVFDGPASKRSRRRLPVALHDLARRKLDLLNAAHSLDDLKAPPGNRLEPLAGDRAGQHSVRINRQYRICFSWTPDGPADVEIVDYH